MPRETVIEAAAGAVELYVLRDHGAGIFKCILRIGTRTRSHESAPVRPVTDGIKQIRRSFFAARLRDWAKARQDGNSQTTMVGS